MLHAIHMSFETVRQTGFVESKSSKLIFRLVCAFVFVNLIALNYSNAQNVIVTGALIGDGSYATLTDAFNAINSGAQTGANINIAIIGNTTEPAGGAIIFNGAWNSILIQPSGGAARTITGAITPGGFLVGLEGADFVTIDGLNSDGNALTISNTTVSNVLGTGTIRIRGTGTNPATNNVITRCTVLGSSNMDATVRGGNIWFGGNLTSIGNDNNVISFCDIGPAGGNLPSQGFHFAGITTDSNQFNSSDTIRNCNIYDYFSASTSSAGVYVEPGTTNLIIKDNKFYQTAARTQTTGSQHSAIWINNPSGNNFDISGNTIGYSNSVGTGTYSLTGLSGTFFYPIYIKAGTTSASNIQGNIITGLSMGGALNGFGAASPLRCIYADSGIINIGNITGNTIGDLTKPAGSIAFSNNNSSTIEMNGIYISGSSNCITSNNKIGGVVASSTGNGNGRIFGIKNVSTGFWTCQNNILGTWPSTLSILTRSNSAVMIGIENTGGEAIISGNNISRIAGTASNQSGYISPIAGISVNVDDYRQIISQNRIQNISGENGASFNINRVTGIYFSSISTDNIVEKNLITSLNTFINFSTLIGIHANGGTATYKNNIIQLGITPQGTQLASTINIQGIYESNGINNFYNNSVYVGGAAYFFGTANTFAFFSSVTNISRNYLNNIFCNTRYNDQSAMGQHYSISVGGTAPNPSGLISNNNILIATAGVLGLYDGANLNNLIEWKTATGQDNLSMTADPKFINPAGDSSQVNLHIANNVPTSVEGRGIPIASVTDDFDGEVRSTLTPTDIGADAGNFIPLDLDIMLDLKMFIEGFYNSSSNLQVSDSIIAYLRNSSSPYGFVDSARAVVSDSGKASLTFSNASNGTYYIVLKHRNSIETWSANGILITQGNSVNYDFTNAAEQAYGDNMKQVDASPVHFAIYSGDVNQDGVVDLTDNQLIDNDAYNFVFGYVSTDVNGDGIVDIADATIGDNNAFDFVSVIRP